MQISKILVVLIVMALAASIATPIFAQDGGAMYKAKCAGCHGPEGQGKMGPALKGTSLSADQIVDVLTKGNDAKKAPHKKPLSGMAADDAKAVAAYVKGMK
jgi:mono/diheme cytochrome c family protein